MHLVYKRHGLEKKPGGGTKEWGLAYVLRSGKGECIQEGRGRGRNKFSGGGAIAQEVFVRKKGRPRGGYSA